MELATKGKKGNISKVVNQGTFLKWVDTLLPNPSIAQRTAAGMVNTKVGMVNYPGPKHHPELIQPVGSSLRACSRTFSRLLCHFERAPVLAKKSPQIRR